jgi:hypothetical protein
VSLPKAASEQHNVKQGKKNTTTTTTTTITNNSSSGGGGGGSSNTMGTVNADFGGYKYIK